MGCFHNESRSITWACFHNESRSCDDVQCTVSFVKASYFLYVLSKCVITIYIRQFVQQSLLRSAHRHGPFLHYNASSVWSPNTDQDINKLEAAQRRAARWATRDYKQMSSVTEMLGNLRWRPLDQRRIDNRLIMLYKITFDLVAIPVEDYLVRNRRESKFIHPLAYRQIQTSTNYYKFSFFPRTIVHWNALPTSIVMLPTLAQLSHAVCQVVHVSP